MEVPLVHFSFSCRLLSLEMRQKSCTFVQWDWGNPKIAHFFSFVMFPWRKIQLQIFATPSLMPPKRMKHDLVKLCFCFIFLSEKTKLTNILKVGYRQFGFRITLVRWGEIGRKHYLFSRPFLAKKKFEGKNNIHSNNK